MNNDSKCCTATEALEETYSYCHNDNCRKSLQTAAETLYSADEITYRLLEIGEVFLLGIIHRENVCDRAKTIAKNILRDIQHKYEPEYELEKIDIEDKIPLHESKQIDGKGNTSN